MRFVQARAQAQFIVSMPAQNQFPTAFFNYSTHAFSVAEAVELARVLHQLPPHLTVYGIEGGNFEAGMGLSPDVEGAVAAVIAQVVSELHAASLSEPHR